MLQSNVKLEKNSKNGMKFTKFQKGKVKTQNKIKIEQK